MIINNRYSAQFIKKNSRIITRITWEENINLNPLSPDRSREKKNSFKIMNFNLFQLGKKQNSEKYESA